MSDLDDERYCEIAHVSIAIGMSRFFGSVRLRPGYIAFEPQGIGNKLNLEPARRIVHSEPRLTVLMGRLLPPWMNSGIVLVDQNAAESLTGTVTLTGGQRRWVIDSARAAGFEVDLYKTWTSAGGSIGSVAELERFRRSHAPDS